MAQITITEALADLKTIDKKLEKKRLQVRTFLHRQEALKDPLSAQGGSVEYVRQELQAIKDLEARKIAIRTAVAVSNLKTEIVVGSVKKTVAEWLFWRREVAPNRQAFLTTLRHTIDQVRTTAQQRGASVVAPGANETKPTDFVINLDEVALGKETEILEDILGTLDGKLSLFNATTVIEI